jgi:hypothetical protein
VFPDEGSILLEEDGSLQAILIREGVSKNGNRWSRPILDQIAKLAKGLPIHFYDMSESGDGSFTGHWASLLRRFPGLNRFLPERIAEAEIGRIAEAWVDTDAEGAFVRAKIMPGTNAGWFRGLLERARAVARRVGLSIHVPADGIKSVQIKGGGVDVQEVTRIVGWDVVSFPSAGGAFESVLEALKEATMKGLVSRLLRLVRDKAKRTALEGKAPKGEDLTIAALVEGHGEWVTQLFEALSVKAEAATRGAVLEALYRTAPESDPAPAGDPGQGQGAGQGSGAGSGNGGGGDAGAGASAGSGGGAGSAATEGLAKRIDGLDESVKKILKANGKSLIESVLKTAAATLPKGLQEFLRGKLTARLEAMGHITEEEASAFVADLKKGLGEGQSAGAGGGLLESGREAALRLTSPQYTKGHHALAALEALLEGKPRGAILDKDGKVVAHVDAFRGIRHAYSVLTGDHQCEGLEFYIRPRRERLPGALESLDLLDVCHHPQVRWMLRNRAAGVTEEQNTTDFVAILSEYQHKRLAREYAEQPMTWRLIASPENVTDFKNWRILKLGEFGNFANVAEGGAYLDIGGANEPTEEEITLKIVKRGGLYIYTWEMIVNDDTRAFQRIPGKLARAAARTLNEDVWDVLLNNGNYQVDATAIFHATHNNLVTTALSLNNLKTMRREMVQQKDIDDREAGRVVPRNVFVGSTIYDAAYELIMSDRKPVLVGTDSNQAAGTAKSLTFDNQNVPNIVRGDYGLQLHEVLYFDDVDADTYIMAASPDEAETVSVGFLNGNQTPSLFVQDMQNVGSFFTNEKITLKVRHIWDAECVDFRGLQRAIP